MASIITSTIVTAHAAEAALLSRSEIKIGDQIPAVEVKENNHEETLTLNNIPGKSVLIGVPAAFSPPCGNQIHNFINDEAKYEDKNATVYIITVNDVYVTQAWREKLVGNTGSSIHVIADDRGAFSSASGMLFDATDFLGGPRSKRYAIIAEDGIVSYVAVEPDTLRVTVTASDEILKRL